MTKKEKMVIWAAIAIHLCVTITVLFVQSGLIKRSKDITYYLEHTTCPHILHGLNK